MSPPRLDQASATPQLRNITPPSGEEWPCSKPPSLLSKAQLEDLDTYITWDTQCLSKASFEQLVNEQRGRSNFHLFFSTVIHCFPLPIVTAFRFWALLIVVAVLQLSESQ
jgi:hypothetical protein